MFSFCLIRERTILYGLDYYNFIIFFFQNTFLDGIHFKRLSILKFLSLKKC